MKHLILFSILAVAPFAHADCTNILASEIQYRDNMFSAMVNEETSILNLDRAFFYVENSVGQQQDTFNALHLGLSSDDPNEAMATTSTTEFTLSPVLIPMYYIGNSTTSSTNATSMKISASDLNEIYELLIEASVGEGKHLQAFVQDIKDKNGINVTKERIVPILTTDDSNERFCKRRILTIDQIRKVVISQLKPTQEK